MANTKFRVLKNLLFYLYSWLYTPTLIYPYGGVSLTPTLTLMVGYSIPLASSPGPLFNRGPGDEATIPPHIALWGGY